MKYLLYLCVVAVLFVTACTSDKTRPFIPGTYINTAGGEHNTATDTLVIEAVESNNYLIHRKTGFRLIRNGKAGKHQHETEEWKAIYDEGTKTLTETKKGKLITFYPDSGKLLVGKREYKKLN